MADDRLRSRARLFRAKEMVSRVGGVTIRQMMEELGVNRRSVHRILEELRGAGTAIDVVGTRGKQNVYGIEQHKRGALIQMSEFEMMGVAVAQQIARYLEGTPMFESLDGVFTKIEAALKKPDLVANLRRKIHDVNEGAMRFGRRDNGNLQALIDALLREHRVAVRHVTVDRGRTEFLVDPYTLLLHRKGPYLVGLSHHPEHSEEPIRKLAFDGVRSLKWCKGQRFRYPAEYSPEQLLRGAFGIVHVKTGPERIRIRFRAKVERWVRRRLWHRSQKIGEVERGWFEFEMRCHPSVEVDTWVLGWGHNAEVLEPAALRERVAAEVAKMGKVYAEK